MYKTIMMSNEMCDYMETYMYETYGPNWGTSDWNDLLIRYGVVIYDHSANSLQTTLPFKREEDYVAFRMVFSDAMAIS